MTGQPIHVLLVEDNAADARYIRELLHDVGASAFVVHDADRLERAVAAVTEEKVDIVLLDLGLPDSRGLQTLTSVSARTPGTPIIVLTGFNDEALAILAGREGAQDYLVKGQADGPTLARSIRYAIERNRAERAIQEREEQFRQLADNISEVFYILDARFRETLYINPAYERVFGKTRRSLYEDPGSFLHGVVSEDLPALLETISRNQRGEDTGEVEFRIVHPDGEQRWVRSQAVPIRNEHGDVYRISGVALDITERRKAQEALAESEARYRAISEASFDGIGVAIDGVLHDANRGFAEMFGYELEEAIGRPITDFVAPESRDEMFGGMLQGTEGTHEIVGLRKDGKRILIEATSKVHEAGGRTVRIAALRDLTEKRTLEDQLRQAQKMEAVGRLAGGVAHDFNNLLTVITSYTELLLEGITGNDPRRDDLEQIRKAAEGAASLTRQLLAFSRQQVVQPRHIVVEEVIAGAEKLLKRVIGEDIRLETVFSPVTSTVVIDPGQLEQAIMNLAVNARDAMPDGGRLTIETARVDLDEDYARTHVVTTPGRYAMLSVSDTGVGMDAATQARIFEPFFTTKELGKGTGLGLSTVYGIIKQSNGFIWVYSEPGAGTTFKIYLPLAEGPVEHAEAVPAAPPDLHGAESVMLVEDAAAVRAAVRQVLENYGYRVTEAPNARAALDVAAKGTHTFDLLLTDVVMPEMSGQELAVHFTALQPDARVLFMSGYTDDAVVRHGVLQPGTAYLQKPFSPDALVRKLRNVLDARRPG